MSPYDYLINQISSSLFSSLGMVTEMSKAALLRSVKWIPFLSVKMGINVAAYVSKLFVTIMEYLKK